MVYSFIVVYLFLKHSQENSILHAGRQKYGKGDLFTINRTFKYLTSCQQLGHFSFKENTPFL